MTEPGKMSLQEKIAELERRIVTLESYVLPRTVTRRVTVTHERAFGRKWREMWHHIDEYFKSL